MRTEEGLRIELDKLYARSKSLGPDRILKVVLQSIVPIGQDAIEQKNRREAVEYGKQLQEAENVP